MGKSFTRALVLSLAVSSLPLACGDDEEGDGGGGKGKGGSAGMTGGTAGDAGDGGTAGSGATGGTGGQSGTGGQGGTAGQGGTSGTTPGGMGGEDGGMGGVPDTGGMGGEGGGGPTVSLCEQAYCIVSAGAGCTDNSTCESDCLGYYGIDAACDPLLDTFLQCVITTNDSDAFRCDTNKPVYDYASTICNTEWDAFSDCLP